MLLPIILFKKNRHHFWYRLSGSNVSFFICFVIFNYNTNLI
ncbi:Hypothetical protein EUBREC_1307 [Agathobacter rectalis ATCC 33656]|uniref:Uncharacterized protein n=1 Tax=Agathobacter rectalis (strain ATCC 33656 / DSM 3377 / JCM 17463 / KCTC 5835 / VPI 0990) TaxID=515619 RepID=C4Z850_AGARV|nr:Hypothetical protein EUBREC_1307 [Agathobacter rectalis ATCC 33656]